MNDVTLSAVESDTVTQVRMFNGLGCEIGLWSYEDWTKQIGSGQIIVQDGDNFIMEASE